VETKKEYESFFDDIYKISKEVIEVFFDYFGVTGNILYPVSKNNYAFIRLETDNDNLFIRDKAKVLLSLQLIVNTIVKKRLKFEPRIVLDCKDYRLYRTQFLKDYALRKANEVKRTGKIFIFKPLEPYERKIIHITLQDDLNVYTESEGENRYKRLKIIPKKNRKNQDYE
jgi:spoIIIJ-associated protein